MALITPGMDVLVLRKSFNDLFWLNTRFKSIVHKVFHWVYHLAFTICGNEALSDKL